MRSSIFLLSLFFSLSYSQFTSKRLNFDDGVQDASVASNRYEGFTLEGDLYFHPVRANWAIYSPSTFSILIEGGFSGRFSFSHFVSEGGTKREEQRDESFKVTLYANNGDRYDWFVSRSDVTDVHVEWAYNVPTEQKVERVVIEGKSFDKFDNFVFGDSRIQEFAETTIEPTTESPVSTTVSPIVTTAAAASTGAPTTTVPPTNTPTTNKPPTSSSTKAIVPSNSSPTPTFIPSETDSETSTRFFVRFYYDGEIDTGVISESLLQLGQIFTIDFDFQEMFDGKRQMERQGLVTVRGNPTDTYVASNNAVKALEDGQFKDFPMNFTSFYSFAVPLDGECPSRDSNACYGKENGICVDEDKDGSGICFCNPGYSGDQCQTPSNLVADPSNGGHRSLSGGAIAGIVIGILVFLVLVALLAFLLLKRRSKKDGNEVSMEESRDPATTIISNLN